MQRATPMAFTVATREAEAGGIPGIVYTLADETGKAPVRAEVWPAHGFNCLRWQTGKADGKWDDLLYVAPDWDANPVPTRSGHPVLFPFPNRLKHGQFTFEEKTYQLPLNESTGTHAIHGFTPRCPWRVIDSGADATSAFVTGEFQISKDVPKALAYWPADAKLQLTYRLTATTLRVETTVSAADEKAMPFGIGFHPYFKAPGGSADIATWNLAAAVTEIWESEGNMPTGWRSGLGDLDFRRGKMVGKVVLDTLFTSMNVKRKPGELGEVAALWEPKSGRRLSVHVDSAYRELLLFTPTHRKAVAIEAYTCATDAPNLEANNHAAGWRVLAPKQTFSSVVEYRQGAISSH